MRGEPINLIAQKRLAPPVTPQVIENKGSQVLALRLRSQPASTGCGPRSGGAMNMNRWEIDSSHSSVHFSVRHLVIAKVRGTFARWSGTVEVPDGDFSQATVAVTIDASSIHTGVEQRDAHLKSPDFFDVAQYPELRFVGRRVEPRSGAEIDVIGDLTIKGVTREAVLHVERHGQAKDPWGNLRTAFTARTSID